MSSQTAETTHLQHAEKDVSAIIKQLDTNLWNKIALKAIQKMPKHVLSSQSNNMLRDFAFVNSHMQLKAGIFKEEKEKLSPPRERQLAGFAELTKKHIKQSVPEVCVQVPKKFSTRRQNRKVDRVQTQQAVLSTSANLAQTKTNSFLKLFISQLPNQEEIKKEDMMRVSKHEMLRYYQEMQKVEKEQQQLSQQRKLVQQKKVKESKEFTYDYEGKIIAVPPKPGGNIKVFNIKSFFKTTKMPKMHRAHPQQKFYSTDKVATINNKRLVSGQSKLSFDGEDFNNSKLSQKGRLSMQHNLMDLFKSAKQVEMGVSITDMGNKSKILGENNCKEQCKMKLSQFKEMKSAFKHRSRNLTQMAKQSDPKILQEGLNFDSKRTQLMLESEVESKMLSSSFSHFMQRSGKIKKNDRAYTQNFGIE